ncbi:MAG: 3-hydroxyacyl-CoA dehydrogenase [Gammaproteobacteria bacterium]|nr:3-hydroxyacyl-CoA dehydrogenase [Gammaproteobacteria bacterium]
MGDIIDFVCRDQVGILTIDNKPVNAASHAVRSSIENVVRASNGDVRIKAVVLIGAGKTFISGADIREFNKPPKPPYLRDVVFQLMSASKPWIAAIHGVALGGGLEIALGCHYRVALSTASLGFPEVNLGLIPGSGGTVFLPRCVAMKDAIRMITTGKPVSAQDALAKGILSAVVENSLEEFAIEFGNKKAGKPLPIPLSRRSVIEPLTRDEADRQRQMLKQKSHGQQSPVVALETILSTTVLDTERAVKLERDHFERLKCSEQSKALRYIFFAERNTGKLDDLKKIQPCKIEHIGVVGGGTMGTGIAVACLLNGYTVILIETSDASAKLARQRVHEILLDSEKRGLISSSKFHALTSIFQSSVDYQLINDVDLVIEAVYEDLDVKQEVFRKLDECMRPDAVLASNTSYLDVNEITKYVDDSSRVIGLHFFSPAHIMKLVEVIKTEMVTPEVLVTGIRFAKSLSKIPVVSGMCDGFIGNRIMSAYRREADDLVVEGASPVQVDEAMRNFGYPMGIFQMQDLAGLDIAWAIRKQQARTRHPAMRHAGISDRLCELGRFGRKTGSGWYNYERGAPRLDETVNSIIADERDARLVAPRSFSEDEIMKRILNAMQSEARDVLDEGIARCAEDIDVVMTNGYAFPRWKGGPMYMQNR